MTKEELLQDTLNNLPPLNMSQTQIIKDLVDSNYLYHPQTKTTQDAKPSGQCYYMKLCGKWYIGW